jgi:GTP pyrophosphokinase
LTQTLESEKFLHLGKGKGYESTEELIRMIGYGRISASQVIGALSDSPDEKKEEATPGEMLEAQTAGLHVKSVKIKGTGDVMMQLSKCCNPVPGDKIMGYITRGRGLTIHAQGCPNLEALDYDKDRFVDVEWDPVQEGTYSVKVTVVTMDQTGVLAKVSSAISGSQANISRAEITTREDRKAVLDFVIEISNTLHLERTLREIEGIDGVITARRVKSW